jgi:putative ABC transport system substrate-binding protein
MNRRTFLCGLMLGSFSGPLAVEAQQAPKIWRIGYLSPSEGLNPTEEAFDRSMKDLGYVEGRNLRVERRYTGGRPEQSAAAATDLVQLNVDVIVVWTPFLTKAVANATAAIPVVFLAGPPVEARVVGSQPPATMNDEGLADATAASPFRLPRLHPGIGSAWWLGRAWPRIAASQAH